MSLPYDIYPLVVKVLDHITDGRTRSAACDEVGLSIQTFEHYIESDAMLQSMLSVAERRGIDAMADALVTIDNHKVHGQSDPKMAKVISDNIKWVIAHRDKKRFGDHKTIDINVAADKEIVNALNAGKRRALAATGQALPVVDAIYSEVLTPDEEAALYR
jgi:hypothetical protein